MSQEMSNEEVLEETPTETESAESNLDTELEEIYDAHEAEEQEVPQPEQQAPVTPQEEVIPAPNTWGKDSQTLFNQLPADIKKQIVKREGEREAVIRESFAARRFAQAMQPIGAAIQELEGYFKGFVDPNGKPLWGNPQAMAKEIADVLKVKQMLVRDPAAGMHIVRQWARMAGLPAETGEQDEATLNMRVRLAQLEEQEKTRAAQVAYQQQQYQQQQFINGLAQGISDLGAAKDEAGNDAYPHLQGEYGEEIGTMMGKYIRGNVDSRGITPELFKQAYETAVFSHPQLREVEFKRREDARVAQYKKKSQAARRAAGIAPTPGRIPNSEPESDLEQQMNEIWKKYQ